MANKKISELDNAASFDGSESVEIVQVGGNVKTTLSALRTFIEIFSVAVVTTGATITLNLLSRKDSLIVGGADISTNKILALSNTTGAIRFVFLFNITASINLTIPADWVIDDDSRWIRPTLTLLDAGEYRITGEKNSVTGNWVITVSLNKN